jgi:DNA-binding transcriptional MerR regulator
MNPLLESNPMLETLLPPQTYFSIGEVSQMTQVKPYVIRYWETQFGILRPSRRESGQRKFTQKEVDAILRIKDLLYSKGFTIAGARRYLRETRHGTTPLKLELEESRRPSNATETLRSIRKDLEEALRMLKG